MTAIALPHMAENSSLASKRRFPAYPSYRSSGVSWLSSIPEGWSIKRLRYAVNLPTKSDIRGLPLDRSVSFVPMEAVGEYGGLSLEQTRPIEDVLNGYTYFRDGDVLVAKITPCFENGKGALADKLEGGIGFGTTELHVLRAGRDLDSRFLFYLTLGEEFRKLGTAEMYGAGGQKRVPESFIRELRHPIPPRDEQQAIAQFLDRETARIDALIANKRRLIELLHEKRTAVIRHAVTRGLQVDAPMRNCGLQWLGEIPEHWHVKRLKFVAEIGNGSTPSRENPDYWGGWFAWLNSSVVNLPEVTEPTELVSDLALRECHLPRITPPAVLVGITGEGKTRGMVTVLRIEATINQHLAFVRPRKGNCIVEYVRYVLHAAYQFLRDESDGGGSTKGAITCNRLGNTAIPFPPANEQAAIAKHLELVSAKLDALVAVSETAIARLNEYRQSLISAAVTGRIDVRNCREDAPCQ